MLVFADATSTSNIVTNGNFQEISLSQKYLFCFVLGPSGVKLITRNESFSIMMQKEEYNIDEKIELMKNLLLSRENYSEEQRERIINTIKGFKKRIKEKWRAARRIRGVFLQQNKDWLQGTIELPVVSNRPGRPEKSFGELSIRSKRRKTEYTRKTINSDEITYIAQTKLHESGKGNASKVLQDISSSPSRATKYLEAYIGSMQEKPEQLSPVEASSMFVEAGNNLQ